MGQVLQDWCHTKDTMIYSIWKATITSCTFESVSMHICAGFEIK